MKSKHEILIQAADELSKLIAFKNKQLLKNRGASCEEPEYLDFQTCHELRLIANDMLIDLE